MTNLRRPIYRHKDLKRLFDPRSIAIIGATPNAKAVASATIGHLDHYDGKVFRVNAKYDKIGDHPCYPSVKDLPEPADCVVICVPKEAVEASVIECAKAGVGGVVVYASGYAELGKPELVAEQKRLGDIARETGLRILGPNCIGFANFAHGAAVTFTRGDVKSDEIITNGIGLVSQSGALAFSIGQAARRGTRISYVVAGGNSCDIGVPDSIAYMADDPNVKSIMVVLEGMEDPSRLIEAGDIAWAAGKPVVLCKLGVSDQGAEAALSHSGSLAGSPAAYRALFERSNIIVVEDLEALTETASFFAKVPARPKGKGVGVMAVSGGAAVFATDKAEKYGAPMPQPHEHTKKALEEFIPDFGSTRNPADLTAMAGRDPKNIPGSARTLAMDDQYAAVVWPQTSWNPNTANELMQFGGECEALGKVGCVSWLGGWVGAPGLAEVEASPKVAFFQSTDRCLFAVAAWLQRDAKRAAFEKNGPRTVVRLSAADAKDKAAKLINASKNTTLTEREAKEVLACYGVPVVGEKLTQSADEAVKAAVALGMPVAMKVESPDIPHKTEAGVIRLNLKTAEDVKAAYDAVMANANKYNAKAKINGVLVQPMAPSGTEIMVGGKVDPLFGPLIITGLGGVLVELLKDTTVELAPITTGEAKDMLAKLKGKSALAGFRGSEPVDQDKLADVITRLAEFLADQKDLVAELDVNPLICAGSRIVAVDALIIKK